MITKAIRVEVFPQGQGSMVSLRSESVQVNRSYNDVGQLVSINVRAFRNENEAGVQDEVLSEWRELSRRHGNHTDIAQWIQATAFLRETSGFGVLWVAMPTKVVL